MKDRADTTIFNTAMTALLEHRNMRVCADPSLNRLRVLLYFDQDFGEILTLSGEPLESGRSLVRQFTAEELSVYRKVDLDVANTTIELSAVNEDDYASVAFGCLWNIAHSYSSDRQRVCCLISILDQGLIANLKPEWQLYESTCRLAFFRGQPNDYFANLSEVIGAVAILRLDYVASFSEFDEFIKSLY